MAVQCKRSPDDVHPIHPYPTVNLERKYAACRQRTDARGALNLRLKESLLYLTILLLVCGLALASYFGERLNNERYLTSSRVEVEKQLAQVRNRLEFNLQGDMQLIQGLVSYIAANPGINQKEFERAAKPLFEGGSSLRNIGAAPGMVMRMMYPLKGNEKAIGLDFRKTPGQSETAELARSSGRMVLAGPLQLVQGGTGIIGRIPVFVDDGRGGRKFWGLISAVIDTDRLFRNSGLTDADQMLELALRGKDGKGSAGEVFFGRAALFEGSPVVSNIAVPGGSWQIAAIPHGGWPVSADDNGSLRLAFFAIGLLILVPFFALARATSRQVQVQQAQQDTLDLFNTVMKILPTGLWVLDKSGKVLFSSDAAQKIWAGARHAGIQQFGEYQGWRTDTGELMQPHEWAGARALEKGEVVLDEEIEIECFDGSRKFILDSAVPMRGTDGSIRGAVTVNSDITERKHAELALRQSKEQLAAILNATTESIFHVDRHGIILAINEVAARRFGQAPQDMTGKCAFDFFPPEVEGARRAGLEEVFRSGKGLVREDVRNGRNFLLNYYPILDSAGETASVVVYAADITERKRAEIALQEQKNFLSAIFESEPECVKVVDREGRLTQMNPAGLAMLEASSVEEVNACGLIDFLLPEHRIPFKNLTLRVFQGESGVLEFEMRGREGTRRWLETHATPLRDAEGRITHLLGVTRDVTRRRAAEQRLALTLKGADLALTDWHVDSDTVYFGEGWSRLLGYDLKELAPSAATLGKLMRHEDVQSAKDILVRHLKGETPALEAEVRMRHKDGHWVWVLARGMAVERDASGRAVRVAGTAMDISGRKQAESEIARLSQWNELLLNSAGEGIYGVDMDGSCTFINPAALEILGFEKEEVLGRNQHVIFHHHRQKDGTLYPAEECPVYQTLKDGIQRRVEDAFIRKNGEVFPVQLTVTAMHEDGRIVGVEAVFQDIAQRKEMEQELIRLATTDALTGMANRRHFIELMTMELAHHVRFNQPAAFLMMDIDFFKGINDTYGHATGDKVLKHFADLARQRLRRVDQLGRLGGEEFGILLPGTDQEGAVLFAERFRNYVADTPALCDDVTVPLTVSIGVALFGTGDTAVDSIMARADKALYRAKSNGRNRVEMQ